ncbi:FdtA/QdtA family cupin domain-containing protein [Chryseolinea sp. H1M3-3]|uniref:sugar 3,4-ketoisomerase n=1 Tax=Chryseolinea sp. H1M3-3 TaxID=3034144 RepID=UPI0023EDE464|nr:FdtA/QdtA family cupin domain-containing protein [Chryseolinea sp. H1M3-3]
MTEKPRLITLPKVNSKSGTLSFMEVDGTLPFDVKQLYWIYNIETEAHRGDHAHLNTDRVIVCISGVIDVVIEDMRGNLYEFQLNDPAIVLYYPRLHWIKLRFHQGALATIGASDTFKNDITIKDFQEFKKLMV